MIKITRKGQDILFDDEDWILVKGYVIHIDSKGYGATTHNGKTTRLHRLLMSPQKGEIVDHKNQNKLDNRRNNLRITTRNGNARNSKFRSHNTSGFRGVHFCKQTGRWRAEIRINGKGLKLGRYDRAIEAAYAYDFAAIIHHREFAVLNFPTILPTGKGCEE